MKSILTYTAIALSVAFVAPSVHAAWPEKAVTIVVPFPAGGGTDAFARPLAAELSKQLGQDVIIDNKGGVGGTLGAGIAARAKPDGYTFFMGGAHHAVAPAIYKSLSYDIEKDFTPVALLAQPPQVVVINPERIPVTTLAELLAHVKANPGQVSFGSAGVGSTHHLAGALFALKTGAELTHVPYQGAGPMIAALKSGDVGIAFDGLGSSASHISEGTVRALAVAAADRVPSLAGVPTAAQAGVDDYEVSTWYAMWAPVGTPQEVTERMINEIKTALAKPSIKQFWEQKGTITPNVMGADFGKFVSSEVVRWGDVAKQAGVEPQ